MKKASYIFGIVRDCLHSTEFAVYCRLNPCDFTRHRFLTCQIILLFILNLLKKSIPKEMISFSEYCEIDDVTRSAVTQARAKLAPGSFVKLNDILIKEFYTDNLVRTFCGLIVLAIDGTTLDLPLNSPEIVKKYGYASNQTNTKVPKARASYLYDVMNGIILDSIISPYCTSERDMAIQHFEKLRTLLGVKFLERILVIFDRGYPSAALIIYLRKHNIKFLMRCNTKFMREVDDAVARGKKDVVINFSVNRTGAAKAELKELFPDLDMNEKVTMRVLVINLQTDEREILLTSLLDKEQYPHKIFLELYFKRWGVEVNYRFHKCQLEIENFSGKSCVAIEQEFHATILAANARGLLALEAEDEMVDRKKSLPEVVQNKYVYKINKNISMERLKNEFVAVLLDPEANIEEFCLNVKKTMKRNLVPIRPHRTFKRLLKHQHRRYHMNRR